MQYQTLSVPTNPLTSSPDTLPSVPYNPRTLVGYAGTRCTQGNPLEHFWGTSRILGKDVRDPKALDWITYQHYRDNTSEQDILLGRFPAAMAYSLWYYGDAHYAMVSLAKGSPRLALFIISSKVRRIARLGSVRVRTTGGFTREYPIHPETMMDRTDIIQSILANRIQLARVYPSLPGSCVIVGDCWQAPNFYRTGEYIEGTRTRVYPSIPNMILGLDREYHNKARTPVDGYWMQYDTKDNHWVRMTLPRRYWGKYRSDYDKADANGTLETFPYRFHRFIPNTLGEYLASDADGMRPDYGSIEGIESFAETLTESEQRAFAFLSSVSTCKYGISLIEHAAGVGHGTIASIHYKLRVWLNDKTLA